MVCEKVSPQNSFSYYLSEVVHGAAVGRQCACWRCVMVERDGLVGSTEAVCVLEVCDG